jgi:uncharacterized protein with PIN domain
MFVDASAIVAILTREPEADALADVLVNAPSPITSPIATFEAVIGVCRKRHTSVEEAEENIREFLGVAGVRTLSVTERKWRRRSGHFAVRQGTRASGLAQPRGLLCVCHSEKPPRRTVVQARVLRQDRIAAARS